MRQELISQCQGSVLLPIRSQLAFVRFFESAVRDVAHRNRFFVFNDSVCAELLKIVDAAEPHVAPLNQPRFGIPRGVFNRFAI